MTFATSPNVCFSKGQTNEVFHWFAHSCRDLQETERGEQAPQATARLFKFTQLGKFRVSYKNALTAFNNSNAFGLGNKTLEQISA
ncbi:hypothetical protein PoB_006115000 [Plakobranchus ocellatus]|uniref:Uncharacterized protein n=1 Tax=Plakobranchus ocellatus TaxID=259542 RepID=A0AAV4CS34_9GAST|nr:hypothetical protein PoB_006115000 [Plakobranchus ocellatus]